MKHKASPKFWKEFNALPASAQRQAKAQHKLLVDNPHHPSLRLKQVGDSWSVRISRELRALAKEVPNVPADGEDDAEKELVLNWFWIGHHADYDKILAD